MIAQPNEAATLRYAAQVIKEDAKHPSLADEVEVIASQVEKHLNPNTDPCPGQIAVNYDEWLAMNKELKQLREILHKQHMGY